MTDGWNNELLVRYLGHDLNNELLLGSNNMSNLKGAVRVDQTLKSRGHDSTIVDEASCTL